MYYIMIRRPSGRYVMRNFGTFTQAENMASAKVEDRNSSDAAYCVDIMNAKTKQIVASVVAR